MRISSIIALVAAVAAAPPTPDQLHPIQMSALAAHSSTAALASSATARSSQPIDAPRPKVRRSAEPEFFIDSHSGHDQVLRKRQHGRALRKRRLDDVEPDNKRRWAAARRAVDAANDEVLQARDELEQRAAEQYPLVRASNNGTQTGSSANAAQSAPLVNSAVGAPAPLQTPSASAPVQPSGYFTGVSSYYLFALADADRHAVLDAIKGAGFTIIRIFVASVGANNKGSNNVAVPDLEPSQVGQYDDTILELIDQLMLDCSQRGLKLLIAMTDRYALGFWSTDSYATALGIVPQGSTGPQKIADASRFYTSQPAVSAIDRRINHILNHENALLGNKRWAELGNVIYALEAQNEPMGHMPLASNTWVCERSQYIKAVLPPGSPILVSSGGGITITTSLGSWATECPHVDIVSVHDYGTNPDVAVAAIQNAASGDAKGKTVMMGEWGISGANKAATIQSFVRKFKAAGLPWMYWQVTKPGQGAKDFEVWTDEPSWQALTGSNAYFPPTAAAPTVPAVVPGSASSSARSASSPSAGANSSSKPPQATPSKVAPSVNAVLPSSASSSNKPSPSPSQAGSSSNAGSGSSSGSNNNSNGRSKAIPAPSPSAGSGTASSSSSSSNS